MNSFDGAITAAIEFQIDDFGNRDVNWHNEAINNGNNALITRVDLTEAYSEINKDKKVLSKIGKKIDTFVIQGAVSTNGTDIVAYYTANSNPSNDILFLTVPVKTTAQTIYCIKSCISIHNRTYTISKSTRIV